MKKTLLLFFMLFLPLFGGCVFNQKEIGIEDSLTLQVGDTYQLQPLTEPVVLLQYSSSSPIVEVDRYGLVEAIETGEAIIYIEAKGYKKATVLIEVVDLSANLNVYFVDVGQADCMIAMLPNGEVLMIDSGLDHLSTTGDGNYPSWSNIKKVLNKENIEVIDHFIITHYHSDHYYYAINILNDYEVKNVYSSGTIRNNSWYYSWLQAIEAEGLTLQVVTTGDWIIEEEDLTLQVLSAKTITGEEDINYSSVMTKLTYKERSFVFTGDAGSDSGDGETIAFNSGIDLKADVLKVGHHGSMYASGNRFLYAVMPTYAIITTAEETSTGHPHISAVNRILGVGAKIYQSKTHGTILVTTDGNTLDIIIEKGEHPQ